MAVTVRTPLWTDLGIDYPIVSVGFSLSAGPELVAAVTAGHRPARHTIPAFDGLGAPAIETWVCDPTGPVVGAGLNGACR